MPPPITSVSICGKKNARRRRPSWTGQSGKILDRDGCHRDAGGKAAEFIARMAKALRQQGVEYRCAITALAAAHADACAPLHRPDLADVLCQRRFDLARRSPPRTGRSRFGVRTGG